MSKIALTPNASGTGTFTIAAPNSNTDRTLTLPDETGEVLTDQADIEAQVKTATNATGSAPVYAARAWINFNGTGTVAIRADGNVSSITDNATGTYTISFTNAMSDANYDPSMTVIFQSGGLPVIQSSGLFTGYFAIYNDRYGVGPVDPSIVTSSVTR